MIMSRRVHFPALVHMRNLGRTFVVSGQGQGLFGKCLGRKSLYGHNSSNNMQPLLLPLLAQPHSLSYAVQASDMELTLPYRLQRLISSDTT